MGMLAALAGTAPLATGAATTAPYRLQWSSNSAAPGQWTLRVEGLNAPTLDALRRSEWTTTQWQKLLTVQVEPETALGTVGMPAMLGAYHVVADAIQFEPLFPLEHNIRYAAVLFPSQLPGLEPRGHRLVSSVFALPRRVVESSTIVTQIYPSADVLPENLLKFYIHFSAPMSRGHIYHHIRLRNAAGREVELPFLEIDEELWDPGLTRLTLFIDPGRIKHGVQPLEALGPALEKGQRYELSVDAAWRDGNGAPLQEAYRKSFRVGPPDREPVQPARWRIRPPRPQTREPLIVDLDEALDHALARRVIHLVDQSSYPLAGEVALTDHERRWTFTPTLPWRVGPYALLVQNTIEDLAGNNVGKTFEVDLFEGVQRRFTNATVRLDFVVR